MWFSNKIIVKHVCLRCGHAAQQNINKALHFANISLYCCPGPKKTKTNASRMKRSDLMKEKKLQKRNSPPQGCQ
jgi:hypothetical protein